jgi:hypothetical protein
VFPIDNSSGDDTSPLVSMILNPLAERNGRPYLVAYVHDSGTHHDIIGSVMAGVVEIADAHLTVLSDFATAGEESDPAERLVRRPALGGRSRGVVLGSTDYDTYVSDFYLIGNSIGCGDAHQALGTTIEVENTPQIASVNEGGGASFGRYMVVVERSVREQRQLTSGVLCTRAIWAGRSASSAPGDGSGTACPCGNNGSSGHGCASSVNAAGALLVWDGVLLDPRRQPHAARARECRHCSTCCTSRARP